MKRAEQEFKRLHVAAMEAEAEARNAELAAEYEQIDHLLEATLAELRSPERPGSRGFGCRVWSGAGAWARSSDGVVGRRRCEVGEWCADSLAVRLR